MSENLKSKNQEPSSKPKKKHWYVQWWAIVLYVIIGLIVIGGLFPSDDNKSETNDDVVIETETNELDTEEQAENTEAEPEAKVIVDEEKAEIVLEITEPQNKQNIQAPKVEVRGKVVPSDIIISINGSEAGVSEDGEFGMMVDLSVGENTINIVATKGDDQSTKELQITRSMTQKELDDNIKSQAISVSYKDLFRNIDSYMGDYIYYTGEVIQVMDSTLRVNVTQGSYGYWDDTVLVYNLDPDSPKILEDDIIIFWGSVYGEESYESILGATITLPAISAYIVELQ